MGSYMCDFEILLNITMEYEVNKTRKKANLMPLVFNVVKASASKVKTSTILVVSVIYLLLYKQTHAKKCCQTKGTS